MKVDPPRALSIGERAVLDLILASEFPGVAQLRRQAGQAQVVGRCGCGCPSVALAVADSQPVASLPDGPAPVDLRVVPQDCVATGDVVLFVRDGRLDYLEYVFYTDIPPAAWPVAERLSVFRHPVLHLGEIRTARAEVTLRPLTPKDADAFAAVMRANAIHLTRFGNYVDEVSTPASEFATQFDTSSRPAYSFGIYEDDELVGSIALVPVEPPKYGLGYWLTEGGCGRGLATLAVAAVSRHAFEDLGATDIFAGVTHHNAKSRAVLERAGFEVAVDLDDYTRYHRRLP